MAVKKGKSRVTMKEEQKESNVEYSDISRKRRKGTDVEPFVAPGSSDRPTEADLLNRTHYVNALAALITHERTEVPLTIGIYGEWGTGKSSFMKQLEILLRKRHQTISFNAWRYHKAEDIWTALVEAVAGALDKHLSLRLKLRFIILSGYAREVRAAVRKMWRRFLAGAHKLENWFVTTFGGVSLLKVIGIIDLPEKTSNDISVDSVNQGYLGISSNVWEVATIVFIVISLLVILGKLRRILLHPFSTQFEVYLKSRKTSSIDRRQMTQMDLNVISSMLMQLGLRKKSKTKAPIVVFLDDLDRCPPDRIVDILEAVNLFFDSLPFVTVFGLSPSVVSKAVANEYQFLLHKEATPQEKEEFGRSFLQKIIHIPFQLPPVQELDNYITSLMAHSKKSADKEDERDKIYFRKEALQKVTGIHRILRYPFARYIDFGTSLARRRVFSAKDLMGLGIMNRLLHGLNLLQTQKEWINTLSSDEETFWNELLEKFQQEKPEAIKLYGKILKPFKLYNKILSLIPSFRAASEKALRKRMEMEKKDVDLLKSFSFWLSGNPRTIKRFVNVYQLAKGINAQLPTEKQAMMLFLAAWLVLLQNWPKEGAILYRAASSNPDIVFSEDISGSLSQEFPEELNAYVRKNSQKLYELAKYDERYTGKRIKKHAEGFEIAGCFSFLSSHVPQVNQEAELQFDLREAS